MLGNAEQYFAVVMDIPRLQQRLDSFVFAQNFDASASQVSARVSKSNSLLCAIYPKALF